MASIILEYNQYRLFKSFPQIHLQSHHQNRLPIHCQNHLQMDY